MIKKLKKIWINGTYCDWDEAKVHILTHTLHYGYAAFEGIRSYRFDDGRSAAFRLNEHLQRLYDSAHLLELPVPYEFDYLKNICIETLRLNGLREGYIRPLVYLGENEVGVYPGDKPDVRVAVATWEWGAYLGEEGLKKGIKVKVSSYVKPHINSFLVKGKIVGHYVNSVLAKIEARREGYAEGILLDHLGYVAEGSGENIFIVKNNEIHTPPESASILSGITRNTIISLVKEMGLKLHERTLTRSELYLADEVFFTGTAAEVTPIREIDGRKVGTGSAGAVTLNIQKAFFDLVRGRTKAHPEWFTFYEI